MKLKRPTNRVSKETGKIFYRYDVTLPPDVIDELSWEEGIELKAKAATIQGKKVMILSKLTKKEMVDKHF